VKVTVHLHTILQHQTPDALLSQLEVEIASGCSLADLVHYLLLAVNGRVASMEQTLQDGDQVNLMPAISGGGASHRCA
jgi:molybdopterin converting factor small subunit